MAWRVTEMGLVIFILMMTLSMIVTTQTSGCTSVIIGLAPCLNYITGNSSTPSSSCCSQLSECQSQPQCLCSVLNGEGAALGLTINQTLAIALPGACNLKTLPLSRCNAAGPAASPTTSQVDSPTNSPSDTSTETPDVPITPMASNIPPAFQVDSPANSPSHTSTETPDVPITPMASDIPPAARSGSKAVPSATGSGDVSDGNITKLPLHLLVFLLLIASCASSPASHCFSVFIQDLS